MKIDVERSGKHKRTPGPQVGDDAQLLPDPRPAIFQLLESLPALFGLRRDRAVSLTQKRVGVRADVRVDLWVLVRGCGMMRAAEEAVRFAGAGE